MCRQIANLIDKTGKKTVTSLVFWLSFSKHSAWKGIEGNPIHHTNKIYWLGGILEYPMRLIVTNHNECTTTTESHSAASADTLSPVNISLDSGQIRAAPKHRAYKLPGNKKGEMV